MSNDYFRYTQNILPGGIARSQPIIESIRAIEVAFNLLPNPITSSATRGFSQSVPVGPAQQPNQAATLGQVQQLVETLVGMNPLAEGSVQPVFRGPYDGGASYSPFDFVSFSGALYVNVQSSTGVAPGNTSYWILVLDPLVTGVAYWELLSGAASRPMMAYHNGDYWLLMVDVTDVTEHEPGIGDVWRRVPEDTTYVTTPSIVSPADGATGFFGEVVGSEYTTGSFFVGELTSAVWQSSPEEDFSVLHAEEELTEDPTVWPMPLPDPLADIWVRVRYVSNGFSSLWSPPVKVTVANYSAPPPAWISPDDNETVEMDRTFVIEEYSPNLPDAHVATNWRVFANGNLVWQSFDDTVNLVTLQIPPGVLQGDTTYTIQAQHVGQVFGTHEWSGLRTFTVARIDTPSVTSPLANATGVLPDALIESTEMSVLGTTSSLTGKLYQYRINDSNGTELWSTGDTSIDGFQIPMSLTDPGTAYQAQVRHYAQGYGYSDWSDPVTFTTTDDYSIVFEQHIGEPYKGGFVVGKIQSDYDGNTYGVIMAGGEGGTPSNIGYGDEIEYSATDLVPPKTMADGYANTQAIINHPSYNALTNVIMEWLQNEINNGSGLNGYTDWYIPARDEFEMAYRLFKPTTRSNNTSTNRSTEGFNDGGTRYGINNNSIPSGSRYYTSTPSQTNIVGFRMTDEESQSSREEHALNGYYAFDPEYGFAFVRFYFTSTENDAILMWAQTPSIGTQGTLSKSGSIGRRARVFRRMLLIEGS